MIGECIDFLVMIKKIVVGKIVWFVVYFCDVIYCLCGCSEVLVFDLDVWVLVVDLKRCKKYVWWCMVMRVCELVDYL